jgi:tRNA (cytidine/uridine-2'-O-)-methyltransferase
MAMFDIVLFQPEIPPNTGNIIRLCANTGCHLHLVKPLGFRLSDRALKRAGLDYHEMASVTTHRDWETCSAQFAGRRTFVFTTRASSLHTEAAFVPGDVFVFGSETRGLPAALIEASPELNRLRLPMRPQSRSLNLSNAVAIVVYEAWRQCGFGGGR